MWILSHMRFGKYRNSPSLLLLALPVAFWRVAQHSIVAACTLMFLQMSWAQDDTGGACGSLYGRAFGPYDYRSVRDGRLEVVETNHFMPKVENLISGMTSTLGSDIDFTLRAFPNHHRALMSMMRLGERLKMQRPTGANYTVECYFDRALRFQPTDNTSRMIYATYLAKAGRQADVLKQLELVSKTANDNPFTHYNMGLIYFDAKEYDLALAQAHIAYSLGFVRTELKDQLAAVGKWKDPDPTAQASEPAASNAAREPAK